MLENETRTVSMQVISLQKNIISIDPEAESRQLAKHTQERAALEIKRSNKELT